jgi:hypothetical protein
MQLSWAVRESLRLHARVTNDEGLLDLMILISYRHHRNGEPGEKRVIDQSTVANKSKPRCPLLPFGVE